MVPHAGAIADLSPKQLQRQRFCGKVGPKRDASLQELAKALAVGWHPWSLCRGLGYGLLTFEVVSYSYQRLTGSTVSTPRRRAWRWALGLALLVLDGMLKWLFR